MQLDVFKSNYLKIRMLLSLYFGYQQYRNSKSGRFKTLVGWDSFSAHCRKNFPSISNFKGKSINSVFGVPKFLASSDDSVNEYAEICGWGDRSQYHYFKKDGILDFLTKIESSNESREGLSFERGLLYVACSIVIIAFFLPFYHSSNLLVGQFDISGWDIVIFYIMVINDEISRIEGNGLYYWGLMLLPILLTYVGIRGFLKLIFKGGKKANLGGISDWSFFLPFILWGIAWYKSGEFLSIFSLLDYGFYFSFFGAIIARIAAESED